MSSVVLGHCFYTTWAARQMAFTKLRPADFLSLCLSRLFLERPPIIPGIRPGAKLSCRDQTSSFLLLRESLYIEPVCLGA